MWPFKTKPGQHSDGAPSKWELDQSRVSALQAWRDVGQEFEYLGRLMIVIGHSRIESSGLMMWLVPEVRARYADDKGQIHELRLSEYEVLAMTRSSDLQPNVADDRRL